MSKPAVDLRAKIARLVEERGWNLDEFARQSGLNRLTVRGIFRRAPRRLHNATVAACARALGFSVYDLRESPLEDLLKRRPAIAPITVQSTADDSGRRYEEATQPELLAWLEHNRARAEQLSPLEWDELLSLQATGGPLTAQGVAHFIGIIERKRRLIDMVQSIAGTEYLDLLEQFVEVLHEKIQPYRNRK